MLSGLSIKILLLKIQLFALCCHSTYFVILFVVLKWLCCPSRFVFIGWYHLCLKTLADLPQSSETPSPCFKAWCGLWTDLAGDAACPSSVVDRRLVFISCRRNKAERQNQQCQRTCKVVSKGCSFSVSQAASAEPHRFVSQWKRLCHKLRSRGTLLPR